MRETTTSEDRDDAAGAVPGESVLDATSEQATTEQAMTEQATTEPATTEQATTEPATGEATTDEAADGGATAAEPKRKLGRRARKAAARERAAAAGDTVVLDKPGDGGAGAAKTGKARNGKAGTGNARTGKEKDAKAGAAPSASRARRVSQVITALLVVAVLFAVLLLTQLIKGPGNGSAIEKREDRREAARQAANTATARLFSFDYRRLDADLAEQRAQTTGDFTAEVEQVTGPNVRPLATKVQAVVQAVALNSAVVDDGNGKGDVQVLVFLNQAVTSSLLPAPRLDRNRVVATMRDVGNGQWKVAGIKAL